MLVILKEGIVWEKSSCRDGKGKIGEDQEGKGKGEHCATNVFDKPLGSLSF